MDLGRLAKQLTIDEGRQLRVYSDGGVLKVGIGHLVSTSKHGDIQSLQVGSKIPDSMIQKLFAEDLQEALETAVVIFDETWLQMPEVAKEVVLNFIFSVRLACLSDDNKIFIYHMVNGQWDCAADELRRTQFYKANQPRALRLALKLENI